MPDDRASPARAAELRLAVLEKYRAVAHRPDGHFPYPIGRASALGLGYRPEWIDRVPAEVVDRFVGVGNPFGVRTPREGERVLDLGCGSGLDAYVASALTGPTGRVVGIDLTRGMLDIARRRLASWPLANLSFEEGLVEDLPFADASFDAVISNGVINLVPDKDHAFREIRRVLRPGGSFAAADLVVVATVPPEVLADVGAWST